MKLRPLSIAACFLLLSLTAVYADEGYSFGQGARGFLVGDYNQKLIAYLRTALQKRAATPALPEVFDSASVKNTRVLQASIQGPHAPLGQAGPAEFAAVGLPWPDDFLRCANLIDCWEGTLAKLKGSAESEDTFPNVTFGIIGFTSHDGSLQEFLQKANTATQGALFRLARDRLPPRDANKFVELIESYQPAVLRRNHEGFVKFAIRNPRADPSEQRPRPEIAALFEAFDGIPHFRDIQLAAARQKSWDAELPDYREEMFGRKGARSLRIDLFCFDMTVLTNGPGNRALRNLATLPWHDEVERMRQISTAMKTSPDYRDDEEKRSDILEREHCIINGIGKVHEDDYDLRAFALLPAR